MMVEDDKLELEEVNGLLIFSGECLQYSRHEAMWKVESAQPVGLWMSFGHPCSDKAHSLREICVPER